MKRTEAQLWEIIVWIHRWNLPPSNCALITPVELDPVIPGQSCGLTNQHYFPNGPTTSMSKEIIVLCCILKELMWKMIGPSLSFKGHVMAQTKAAHQRRENMHEAESIWPSSELAPIKSEHSSQGHLASMFIGLCKDKCTRVDMNVSLHPCVFSTRLWNTYYGSTEEEVEEELTFSPFEQDVSDVATGESVLKKNSTVKFNYIKWTRLKMERVCFKSGPLQLTEHLFYLAKCNVSSAAVLRLRLSQRRKPRYQQSGFRASHSSDTGDGKLLPTVIAPIWSEVELGVKLLCDWGDYFPLWTFEQSPSSDRSFEKPSSQTSP